jgi:AcrR family transcriptional regulator
MNVHSVIVVRTMPRKRSVPDDVLLDAALTVVRSADPQSLTFAALAERSGLAASTIVQRFGTKAALLQAALLRAWDLLDAATAAAIAQARPGPDGVVEMLVRLTDQYTSDAADYADQLLVLREDLRDPVLRERGRRWVGTLAAAVEQRLDPEGGAGGLGTLVVAQWQGTLTVWSFTRAAPPEDVVRAALDELLGRLSRPS